MVAVWRVIERERENNALNITQSFYNYTAMDHDLLWPLDYD